MLLSPKIVLSYEVHGLPGFVGGAGDCVAALEVLEEPRHVASERAHRLHALGVAFALAFFASERHVPVLRRDDGAAQHLERHVHALVRRSRSSAAANRDGRGGLRLDELRAREADALPKREKRAGRLAVIDRRADDDSVRILQLLDDAVGRIVIEHALAEVLCLALIAGDASADRLVSDPGRLRFDAFRGKRVGDFLQRAGSVAVCTRTSVDKQYFHFVLFWHFYLTQRRGEAESTEIV